MCRVDERVESLRARLPRPGNRLKGPLRSTFLLHSEGDKADDKQDAAKGDHTDDRVSSDVNE